MTDQTPTDQTPADQTPADRIPDNRPEPKYGQYAPVAPAATPAPAPAATQAAPPPPPAEPAAAVRPRRTWDVVLTTFLLLLGVYDVATGFSYFADLGATMRTLYHDQGIGEFTSDALASSLGLVINILRIVLIVVAIIVSLTLIGRNRRAFWVPLAAGVTAALAVFVCVVIVVVSDPAFAQYVAERSGTP